MDQKSGAQISTRAFVQSLIILFILMMIAGIPTQIISAGTYNTIEVNGRLVIDPGSFHYIPSPNYPSWRWFLAPIEVLFRPDGQTIIVIIVFLLMVGVSFAVMDKSGLLQSARLAF